MPNFSEATKIGEMCPPQSVNKNLQLCAYNDKRHMCRDVTKRTLGKIKIEFGIAYSRGHSAVYFGTKIIYLAQFLTELLRILSFKTCIMKN